ncbi:MAG: multiheme c-type cytochrome [Myxococcota bacterium]
MRRFPRLFACAPAFIALSSCGNDSTRKPDDTPVLSAEQLMNPELCRTCHAQQHEEWTHSMHAYASLDPVFLAMNRRGQRETAGALGDFCVRCHAPLAVAVGASSDGLNLESLPAALQGVNCYFCHNAKAVEGSHNNPIRLDSEAPLTLRAGIGDPLLTRAHASEASPLLTGSHADSAKLCGACHDIVLPAPPARAPIELERTFKEWQSTLFAPGNDPQNPAGVTCIGCHMPPPARGAEGAVAPGGSSRRKLHDHVFPGVDVALDGPFAGDASELNSSQVQSFLDTTLRVVSLCVEYRADVDELNQIRLLVDIDNVGAGHSFPSGASQDRRAWLDVRVLVDGALVYSSGNLPDEVDVTTAADQDLVLFRDDARQSDGSPAHMFWDVATLTPHTLGGVVTRVVGAPGYDVTHAVRSYPRAANAWIDAPADAQRLRVELRIKVLPVGLDVLNDLVASGDLDPGVLANMKPRTLLPNRNLARPELVSRVPELARFNELSFEWSSLTLRSPYFAPASTRRQGSSMFSCVGMNRAP